jgi:AcrR family transcriptional regulator
MTMAGDGRSVRGERTREAVIEALHGLLDEGVLRPNAREIAERAGVSKRSIFVHFSSLDDLYLALAERATVLVVGMLWPIAPEQPLATRVDALCTQRARINEEIGPLRRAAARQAPFSPALTQVREHAGEASRAQIARVFAPELGRLDSRARDWRIATLDALVSGESWDLLRTTHGLSPDEARVAVSDALRRLLADLEVRVPVVDAPARD